MDNPNITMEEYIRLEEEKARQHSKVYNWETAKYCKIWYDEDVHNLRSVETEFPAIFFNDKLSSEKTLFCEPTVNNLNNNEIDFRISFDKSDDKDYTNKFPAIVYNDVLTSKSYQLTKPTLSPQHIDEFDLKDETSLSEYNEVEQNILYFNDLFSFNIIYPDDLKSDKDNDDDKIDIIQSSGGNVNTQEQEEFLEASHDKINKIFNVESFIMELNVNIVVWNYLVNGMPLNLIKNLYVPFGILFDPNGVYTRMLRRPRYVFFTLFKLGKLVSKNGYNVLDMALPPKDQRHQYLRFEGLQYIDTDIADFELMDEGLRGRMLMEHRDAQGQSVFTSRAWRRLFEIRGPLVHELILEFFSTFRFGEGMLDLDTAGALYRGDRDYWIWFILGTPPSYTLIRDSMLRLCHRLIVCSIVGRSQAPKKVTVTDLFYLRWMDVGPVNVPYLLDRYLRLFASGRKQGAMIFRGQFICMELNDTWAWVAPGPEKQPNVVASAPEAAKDAHVDDEGAAGVPAPVQAPQLPPPVAGPARTKAQRFSRVEEDVHEIRGALDEQREILDSMARDFS
ncbi:hypothetical protein Tco_1288564 [Tanacetum coccineum]